MRVIVLHKIFIASSVGLAVLVAATRFARYFRTHDSESLGLGIGAALAVPVLALYLRWVWKK